MTVLISHRMARIRYSAERGDARDGSRSIADPQAPVARGAGEGWPWILPAKQLLGGAGGALDSPPTPSSDKVRYVGDPIAIVVAETAVQAKDAAEAVFVDIDPLPAVTSPQRRRRARRAAAP
jgi:CO/xanthine dehydrogenase Mo-binding subunit